MFFYRNKVSCLPLGLPPRLAPMRQQESLADLATMTALPAQHIMIDLGTGNNNKVSSESRWLCMRSL